MTAPIRENSYNKFFHQTLPSWNPNLRIKNTTPVFLVSGVVLIIIGVIIMVIFRNVEEIWIDYTYCNSTTDTNRTCADIIGTSTLNKCYCEVPFRLDRNITAPVLLYYALTNFYQNHRSYVSSKDNKQLIGQLKNFVSSDCHPYDYVLSKDNRSIPIAPCGAIANSMFNDQLAIVMINNATNTATVVPLIKKNITWPVMKPNKYRNPPGKLSQAFANFAKPKDWQKNIWELDPEDPDNNGFENEDFIVWMQTATLPSFKKTYRRVNHSDKFVEGLPRGKYILKVTYSFPTVVFKGTKKLVIANTSVLGTRNYFLAFIYIITGVFCLIITIAFYIVQYKYDEYTDV